MQEAHLILHHRTNEEEKSDEDDSKRFVSVQKWNSVDGINSLNQCSFQHNNVINELGTRVESSNLYSNESVTELKFSESHSFWQVEKQQDSNVKSAEWDNEQNEGCTSQNTKMISQIFSKQLP